MWTGREGHGIWLQTGGSARPGGRLDDLRSPPDTSANSFHAPIQHDPPIRVSAAVGPPVRRPARRSRGDRRPGRDGYRRVPTRRLALAEGAGRDREHEVLQARGAVLETAGDLG